MNENMFDAPRHQEFTQGTVFSCAYAEQYPDSSVYGFVITARCDATQDKVPTFSFLPLVTLHDWISQDGANIAMERIHADCENGMKNYLKAASLSESLLSTKSFQEIYESHFQQKEQEKAWAEKCAKIRVLIATHKENQRLRPLVSSRSDRLTHLSSNQAKVDAVIRELCGNRLAGYYLLRNMPTVSGAEVDYVALLREIHHMPSHISKRIVNGIARKDWSSGDSDLMRCPCFAGTDDLAAPVGRLKSPWVEHVMQNFTMLFARIGVADNDFTAVKKKLEPLGLA